MTNESKEKLKELKAIKKDYKDYGLKTGLLKKPINLKLFSILNIGATLAFHAGYIFTLNPIFVFLNLANLGAIGLEMAIISKYFKNKIIDRRIKLVDSFPNLDFDERKAVFENSYQDIDWIKMIVKNVGVEDFNREEIESSIKSYRDNLENMKQKSADDFNEENKSVYFRAYMKNLSNEEQTKEIFFAGPKASINGDYGRNKIISYLKDRSAVLVKENVTLDIENNFISLSNANDIQYLSEKPKDKNEDENTKE